MFRLYPLCSLRKVRSGLFAFSCFSVVFFFARLEAMNSSVLLLAVLVAVASAGVVDLGKNNFDNEISSGVWMVKFYAPWCGHCKRLAPTWDQFGNKADGFKVAKVDCTQHQSVCQKFGVRGYPTLKMFVDGKPTDYKGARSIEAFESFLKTNAGDKIGASSAPKAEAPAATEDAASVIVATDASFDSVIESGKSLVKFYAPWCGHCKRLAPTWDDLPNKNNGDFKVVKVDCTQNKAVCQKYGVRGYPTIKYFADGEKVKDYSGARTADAFIQFVASQ